jgi:uncharacterized membrane protein
MGSVSNETGRNGGKGGKKGLIIGVIVAVVVIIALLTTIIILLVKKDEPVQTVKTEEKRNAVVTQERAEEMAEEMINEEYIPPGYYSTKMSTTWHFATGDSVSEDAYVANDKANSNDVFFDVFLEEDESDPIMTSPVIPRGSELKDIKLDKPLKAGTHGCVMVYHLVDDQQNTVSTLRVGFTIIIDK